MSWYLKTQRTKNPATLLLLLLLVPGGAVLADSPAKARFDSRLPRGHEERAGFTMHRPTPAQLQSAEALRALTSGATIRWDGMSASPSWIAARPGRALSPPSGLDAEEAARAFLREHKALFGIEGASPEQLELTSTVPSPGGGAHLYFTQTRQGLEVFGARVNINLDARGAVRSLGSRLFAGEPEEIRPALTAAQALWRACADVYPELQIRGLPREEQKDGSRRTVFDEPELGRSAIVRLVLFPRSQRSSLAWEVRLAEEGLRTDYSVLIDATTGELLFRENRTLSAQTRVIETAFPQPVGEEYHPDEYNLVTVPSSTPESPEGWIRGDGSTLGGNNATSHLHAADQPGLEDATGVYDHAFATASSALTTAWYYTNKAHDLFYEAGFDEAHGNYQEDNFGQGGEDSDGMDVVVWLAGYRNNAFYSISVDGERSSINFLWMSCKSCSDHDGYPENGGERQTAYDIPVLYHEYAHGVTTRMVGGPADDTCLFGTQSGAMGEGWSDLFAASFVDSPEIGDYLIEGQGIGRDLRHDIEYGDLCDVGTGRCGVHADGMIWGGVLWDLRQSMTAIDPADGLQNFHAILVEALAATPCYPTMLDARDAILDADTSLYGGVHHTPIWNDFASRGMGEGAQSTGDEDTSPIADKSVPSGHLCSPPETPTDLSATTSSPNLIDLAYSADGAAAVEIWRNDLNNALDRSRRIAYTTNLSAWSDTAVEGGHSYRYHLVALGEGGVTCRSDDSAFAEAVATGSCETYPVFPGNVSVTDGDPECRLTLSWQAASPGCAGQPVVYSIYRGFNPGFDPSPDLLIARTAETTLTDIPPSADDTRYYLVLAQHGTLEDPADHHDRGSSQLRVYHPALPTLGRTTVRDWDFDSGAQGWTADSTENSEGGWVLVSPHGTTYRKAPLAPGQPSGGSGQSWVTGDAGGPSRSVEYDCEQMPWLTSPTWDATGGGTILSYDYWNVNGGGSLLLQVDNGSETKLKVVAPFRTVPVFDTDPINGWQQGELDLATLIEPTETVSVTFYPSPGSPLSEFGIDNVKVEAATVCARAGLEIEKVTVNDTQEGWGNGNGLLDPGETAILTFDLTNNGDDVATSPEGELTTDASGVRIHEALASFPDIPAGGTGSSSGDGYTVSIPGEGNCQATTNFLLTVTDAAGAIHRLVWSPEYGAEESAVVLEDTFETDKGWVVDGAGAGQGIWQRGAPVGTMDGPFEANPSTDSPNDAGSFCFVTENGPAMGDPNANDVDTEKPFLLSPLFDLNGYKRAFLDVDIWYYNSSTFFDREDRGEYAVYKAPEDYRINGGHWFEYTSTMGWVSRHCNLTSWVPMATGVRLSFDAIDMDASMQPGAHDHVVEMGVDNVRVTATRRVCEDPGVANPPLGVGDTLRLTRSDSVELQWTPSPTDPSHDAAAYYEVHRSSTPHSGFSVADTTTGTTSSQSQEGEIDYFAIVAVNPAGTSGDEPGTP